MGVALKPRFKGDRFKGHTGILNQHLCFSKPFDFLKTINTGPV